MKRISLACTGAMLAALVALHSGSANAATFSYHGSLDDAGKPAEGLYDLELTLYSASSGGRVIAGPILMYAVPVRAGSFSTQADFGPLTQGAGNAWVAVKVRNAGTSEFAALADRAAVAADATASVCPGAWTLDGNAGTTAGNYLGTADAQPLVLATSGEAAMTLGTPSESATDPGTIGTNVVAGYRNFVAAGVVGVTIAGGGGTYPGQANNAATGDFASIGGGVGNRASGYSVVSGGYENFAGGFASAVAGGDQNSAPADNAFVAGGSSNQAGGRDSFAGGYLAHVRMNDEINSGETQGDYGTFIWSDESSNNNFASTGPGQFLVRAAGGIGLNTNVPAPKILTVAGPDGAIASGFAAAPKSVALFENNNRGFIELLVPAANEEGVLFSLPGSIADGAVEYNAGNNLQGLTFQTNGNTEQMRITSAGVTMNHSGSWTMFSDRRLKRDIASIDHPLATFLGLRGQTFEYIDPAQSMATPGPRMGFIAQDVEKVLPQWVSEDARGYKMVTPTGFEALSVEALRELRVEKDAEIADLHAQLDELTARVAELSVNKGR